MKILARVKSIQLHAQRRGEPQTASVAIVPLRAEDVADSQYWNYALWGRAWPVGELSLAFCDPRMLQEFKPDTEVEITLRIITRED